LAKVVALIFSCGKCELIYSLWKSVWEMKRCISYDPATILQCIYPTEVIAFVHPKTHTQLSIPVLFKESKPGNYPNIATQGTLSSSGNEIWYMKQYG
jgi:hypothetical protein